MQTRTINTIAAVLAGIPGYIMSRVDFAKKRAFDMKCSTEYFLDNLGEIIFLDDDKAFVINAKDLKYLSPTQMGQLNNIGSRLTKLVATKDTVLCTASGHIDEAWLRTLSKFNPFVGADSEYLVKGFAPNYEGTIVGYHMARIADPKKDRLNLKTFTKINRCQIIGLDLVEFEGKVIQAATTLADFQNPKSQVFFREAPIEALKDEASIHSEWKPAPWNGDYNVSNLRGTVQNKKVMYTFLDQNTRTLMVASLTDKSAKVLQEGVKGMLNIVSGAQIDEAHMATVITHKEIIAIGDKKNTIVGDLTSPAYGELARQIRKGKTLHGIYGKENVFVSNEGETQGHLMVTPTKYIETCAS